MTKPHFEDFRYTGPDDRDVIDEIVQNRQRTYAATGFDSDTGEQRLATYLTTPLNLQSDEIVIRATAWSDDNGRDSGATFDAYVAQETGRRVIAVNAPGVEYKGFQDPAFADAQERTPEQLEELRQGKFRKVGAASMRAIENAAEEFGLADREYILSASSMGVALGAGALYAAMRDGITINGVVLAEPVNHITRSRLILAKDFGSQAGLVPGYVDGNPEYLKEVESRVNPNVDLARRVWDDRKANTRYWAALAKGAFLYDLGNIDGLENVPIRITHGAGSKLSPTGAFDEFVSQFEQVADVSAEEFGDESNLHDHPYTMTVQSVIDGVNDVVERAA